MVRGLAFAVALVATNAFVPGTTPRGAAERGAAEQPSTRSRWAAVGVRGHRRRPTPAPYKPLREQRRETNGGQISNAGDDYLTAMRSAAPAAATPYKPAGNKKPPPSWARPISVGQRTQVAETLSRSSPTATPSSTLSTTRRPGRSSTRRCSSTTTRAGGSGAAGLVVTPGAASSRRAAARGSTSSSRGEAARR